MRAATWLALREICARPRRLVLSCLVVAVAVAIVAGVEVASLAREAAVAEEIDAMGPSLYVAPSGTSVDDTKRLSVVGALSPTALERVRATAASSIRATRARAFAPTTVNGVPAVAVRNGAAGGAGSEPRWHIGAELALRAHVAGGSLVVLHRGMARVASVRPRTGDAEDLALVSTAPERSVAEGPSVIEVYLRSGAPSADAAAALRAALPEATVLEVARGELADGGIDAGLRRHRALLALVLGLAVTVTLGIATHLDVADRGVELATLSAIGVTHSGLTLLVCVRAAACAVLGSSVGLLASVAAAVGLTSGWVALAAFAPIALAIAAGALLAGLAASLPVALRTALRSPVTALQEGA